VCGTAIGERTMASWRRGVEDIPSRTTACSGLPEASAVLPLPAAAQARRYTALPWRGEASR
jgi:hypothetical protein